MRTSPGWYSDPSGRFEHRYHNGERWTSDVSSRGVRYVDRAAPERPRGTTASLVWGIVGVCIAWLPVLFVGGLVAGIVAVALAVKARRGVIDPPTIRMLNAATATGVAAILLAGVGVWFTAVLYRAVDRYQNPAEHSAEIVSCLDEGAATRATVRLTNTSDQRATFTVRIELGGDRLTAETGSLDPGASQELTVRGDAGQGSPECRVVRVDGPLPLGLDID